MERAKKENIKGDVLKTSTYNYYTYSKFFCIANVKFEENS